MSATHAQPPVGATRPPRPNPLIPCACSCGEQFPERDHQGRTRRYVTGHNTDKRPLADRFWEKVQRGDPDECWPWLAAPYPNGYGHFTDKSNGSTKHLIASRVAYELTYGPLLPDQEALHTCDNPPCCNPRHLFAGTQADNMADMHSKGRGRKNYERTGGGSLALSAADRTAIIARYRAGGVSQRQLATEYGVAKGTIRNTVLDGDR